MQTFFFPGDSQTGARGSAPHDPAVEASGLAALIKRTFVELQPPAGIGGCIKVYTRRNNRDLFDLYFFSNADSETYDAGGTYTAADIAVFKRTDFEDFPEREDECRTRLQEFARRLVSGKLEPANCE